MYGWNNTAVPGLKSTLAQSTGDSSLMGTGIVKGPHHPISCPIEDSLTFEEDGMMRCVHSEAPYECLRNQAILDTTVAILLIELAVKKFL